MKTLKQAALLIAALLLFTSAGCGSDAPAAETTAAPSQTETAAPASRETTAEQTRESSAEASDERPYLTFYAEKTGQSEADIDLAAAAEITYSVYNCEVSYPAQHIRTPEVVAKAVEVIQSITVYGEPDGIYSTAGGSSLSILDAEGNLLISIAMQDGMIDTAEGRWQASGLGALSDIPGLMDEADWIAWDNSRAEEDEAYRETLTPEYPESLFTLRGKETAELAAGGGADEVLAVYLFYGGKSARVIDREMIKTIYNALAQAKAVGPGESNRWNDPEWSISLLVAQGENTFETEIFFTFHGAYFSAGDAEYEIDDISLILDACEWEEFDQIREKLL